MHSNALLGKKSASSHIIKRWHRERRLWLESLECLCNVLRPHMNRKRASSLRSIIAWVLCDQDYQKKNKHQQTPQTRMNASWQVKASDQQVSRGQIVTASDKMAPGGSQAFLTTQIHYITSCLYSNLLRASWLFVQSDMLLNCSSHQAWS